MIVGHGVDACDVARIQRALEGQTGDRFRARVFTPAEQAYCEARHRARFASYAARFAAKEAAMKALGTGWGEGVGWHDFEVVRGASGPPRLVLHGHAAKLAEERHMRRWSIALSHTDSLGIASVVVEDGARVRRAVEAGGRRSAAGGGRARPRPRGRR